VVKENGLDWIGPGKSHSPIRQRLVERVPPLFPADSHCHDDNVFVCRRAGGISLEHYARAQRTSYRARADGVEGWLVAVIWGRGVPDLCVCRHGGDGSGSGGVG
jgi:hypothetical protein